MQEKVVREAEGLLLNVLGDNQTIKLTGKDTNGQLTMIMQNLPSGAEVPPHMHSNEDEHFHLMEGEVRFVVGEKQYTLKNGDMIFLPRGIPHSLKVTGDGPAKIRLNVVPSGIEDMFCELDSLPAGPPDFAVVAAICGKYGVSFTEWL